jgi:hypothetical protein
VVIVGVRTEIDRLGLARVNAALIVVDQLRSHMTWIFVTLEDIHVYANHSTTGFPVQIWRNGLVGVVIYLYVLSHELIFMIALDFISREDRLSNRAVFVNMFDETELILCHSQVTLYVSKTVCRKTE